MSDIPRPAGPDPARDARVAKRRAEDARAAGRALDRLMREYREQVHVPVEEFRMAYPCAPALGLHSNWCACESGE